MPQPVPADAVVLSSVPGPATPEHPRNTEASLLVRQDHSYLLAYTEFCGAGNDDSAANIVGVTSRDGGRTWGERRIIQPNTGGCNVMSSALLRLDDGAVLLAFIRKDSRSSCTIFTRRSEDEGKTFGERVQVNDWHAYMGIVNDSLVQLRSGRVICPVYFSSEACWTPGERFVARVCFSDDGGRTWHAAEGDVQCPKRGAMEPVILERDDGSLLMLMRTQMGCVYQAASTDQGVNWTPATATDTPSQEAPIAIRAVPDRHMAIAVWNASFDPQAGSHGGRRSPLHIAVSRDEMRSPLRPMILEESEEATFAYASIAVDQDRLLLTYYVGQDSALIDGRAATLLALKFTVVDLTALTSECDPEPPVTIVPPYTLYPTRTSVNLRWFTDRPTHTGLRYWPEATPEAVRTVPPSLIRDCAHEVTIEGLVPGTPYSYISTDTGTAGGFRTLPGNDGSAFSFVVFGDPQSHKNYAESVSLAAELKPDFGVGLGDFVSRSSEENYRSVLSLSKPLLAAAPLLPAIGNHDYRRHARPFAQDNDMMVYDRYLGDGRGNSSATDCGSLRLIILNYPDKGTLPPDAAQMVWLEAQLGDARKAGLKALLFHHCPCFTSTCIDWAVEDSVLPPLLSRYSDVVLADFAGHIHTYERSVVDGVTYVTTGGAGELYEYPVNVRNNPWQVFATDALHLCFVQVNAAKITVRAIGHDRATIDAFDLPLR